MAYARYTEFEYDPERRDEVIAYWSDPDTSHPTDQPGFLRGYVLDSVESEGRLRVLTLWSEPHHFDAYFASPGHRAVGPGLGDLSANIVVRDGLRPALQLVSPSVGGRDDAGHVRIIRGRILDLSRVDELRAFWREQGRAALEEAPGALAARAYVDEAAAIFVVQVWWADAAAATAFVASEEHERRLTEPLSQWVERLDRAEATPLDD